LIRLFIVYNVGFSRANIVKSQLFLFGCLGYKYIFVKNNFSMSVLLIFEQKDVRPWADILAAKLAPAIVEVYPNVENAESVEFVICWKPPENLLSQFPNIKVIQSVGASVDHVVYTQNISKSTIITRIVDPKLSQDMFEFVLMAVLNQLKNVKTYSYQQSVGIWKQHQYKSINETTVAILGLGAIGAYTAKKFAQMGFKVKGWSKSEKNIINIESFYGNNSLGSCLKNADFLINLLPLTEKTKEILNKENLQKLPPHAFLINVGRGEHLVDSDLIDLLDFSCLSGALLDVFRTEPLPKDHAFWSHPNIQISPHIASLTNIKNATEQIAENFKRHLNNKELLNQVIIP